MLNALLARTASRTEPFGFRAALEAVLEAAFEAALDAAFEAAAAVESCADRRVTCLSAKDDRRPAPRRPSILTEVRKRWVRRCSSGL